MAMLILVSGLPGTGKTTFADALAQAIHARRLNSDIIRTELNKRGMYDPLTKQLIYDELIRRCGQFLLQNQTVIVDATFYKNSLRQPFVQLAQNSSAGLKWIEICARESTVKERLKRKRQFSEADFSVYQNIKAQYEPLTFDHLVLWSDQNTLAEMTATALKFIHNFSTPSPLGEGGS